MKHKIFYFTGTGNSLWVTRVLSSKLENSEIIPILNPSMDGIKDSETVGIVFPVYMHRIRYLVSNFIKALPELDYLYAVGVNAGDTGQTFSYFKKQLSTTPDGLKAGFSIITPSNYLPFGEAVEGEKRTGLLNTAKAKLERISSIIKERKTYFDKEDGFFQKNIAPGLLYSMGYKYLNFLDKNFYVEESCTFCGICEKVCPVGNITRPEGRPVWHKSCQMCFACINLCPESSIQYGKKTPGMKRYRNPEVSVADIVNQKS
ncbi:MAG: EFR1 family ferrodoxin [Spirochaetales bacterium]|nr:EFR1 family ferrodoxin [Spirochaetales bacterium]